VIADATAKWSGNRVTFEWSDWRNACTVGVQSVYFHEYASRQGVFSADRNNHLERNRLVGFHGHRQPLYVRQGERAAAATDGAWDWRRSYFPVGRIRCRGRRTILRAVNGTFLSSLGMAAAGVIGGRRPPSPSFRPVRREGSTKPHATGAGSPFRDSPAEHAPLTADKCRKFCLNSEREPDANLGPAIMFGVLYRRRVPETCGKAEQTILAGKRQKATRKTVAFATVPANARPRSLTSPCSTPSGVVFYFSYVCREGLVETERTASARTVDNVAHIYCFIGPKDGPVGTWVRQRPGQPVTAVTPTCSRCVAEHGLQRPRS